MAVRSAEQEARAAAGACMHSGTTRNPHASLVLESVTSPVLLQTSSWLSVHKHKPWQTQPATPQAEFMRFTLVH